MEDLARQWNYLSLSEKEGGGDVCFEKDRCSKEYIIAAQFFTKWALSMEAVARMFKPLWRADNGFTVSNEGSHKALFIFDNKEDVDRILSSEPWSFDKYLVVLERYERQTPLEDLKFDKASFWVQVHNIPIGYRNKSVAEDICEVIGQVDRSTSTSVSEGGNYIRVRVTLDVYQPLCRGRIVTFEDGGKIWVNFKYERLPNICYWCGCFDHGDKDYDIWIQSKGTLRMEERQFGSWIRAEQSGPPKKNVVRVSGYYEDRTENLSTRRRREMKSGLTTAGSIPKSNPTVQMNKETSDTGEDSVNPKNINSHNHDPASENSIPAVQDHENQGRDFDEEIREIDTELGIYEEPQNSGYTENVVPLYVNSQSFNMEKLKNELASNQTLLETPLRDELSHKFHATTPHDMTNYSHAPQNFENPS